MLVPLGTAYGKKLIRTLDFHAVRRCTELIEVYDISLTYHNKTICQPMDSGHTITKNTI